MQRYPSYGIPVAHVLPLQERLPAKERRLLEKGGNMLVPQNYDVAKFHQDYIR